MAKNIVEGAILENTFKAVNLINCTRQILDLGSIYYYYYYYYYDDDDDDVSRNLHY